MTIIQTLGLAFGPAWVSGINLYAMVATLGLLGRFGGLKLPGELSHVTNGWIIGVAIALYCIEFVADKVPWLDSIWDVIHTFIRVPAGAVVAAAALGDFSRPVQVIAFMVGGGLALSSHGTKAGIRALLNLSPEPVTNIVVSIIEDVIAFIGVFIAVFAPLLALLLLACALVLTVLLLPRIVSVMRRSCARVRKLYTRRQAVAY
jgi:hypothetical protein